ncbi:MAG: phosphoenolpyruvate carboxykinase domain-containing protein [bacterium]
MGFYYDESHKTGNAIADQFIDEAAEMFQPDNVFVLEGGSAEYNQLVAEAVANNELLKLAGNGNYAANSNEADTARDPKITVICSDDKTEAGGNHMDPKEMREILSKLSQGSMKGRTMYVIPYAMGPLDNPHTKIGFMVTDSRYVAINQHIMVRVGQDEYGNKILKRVNEQTVFGNHSTGQPLAPGQEDVLLPSGLKWSCRTEEGARWISHFVDGVRTTTRKVGEFARKLIWSFGSGYGGNALLGKKCHALRMDDAQSRDSIKEALKTGDWSKAWVPAHMALFKMTNKKTGEVRYGAGAFPSGCGKTNIAMLPSTLPDWEVSCLGDDIVQLTAGKDSDGKVRIFARNTEAGMFGVGPGTSPESNAAAIESTKENTIFTNYGRVQDVETGEWYPLHQGMFHMDKAKDTAAMREYIKSKGGKVINWQGEEIDINDANALRTIADKNARYTTPATGNPKIVPEWNQAVPLDFIVFGGRQPEMPPAIVPASLKQAMALFMGLDSLTTMAEVGKAGERSRDPGAMKPFFGKDMAGHFQCFYQLFKYVLKQNPEGAPTFAQVNWFRLNEKGEFMWPGYGDNIRILEWILKYREGKAEGIETPIGVIPDPKEINMEELTHPDGRPFTMEDMQALMALNSKTIQTKIEDMENFFTNNLDEKLPKFLKWTGEKIGFALKAVTQMKEKMEDFINRGQNIGGEEAQQEAVPLQEKRSFNK